MSLKKNLLKNGLASTLQKGIRVLEQLFLVPFFISAWGAEYYGEWLTLTIIPSVLAFSELGFGTAASNTMVLRYAAGDKQGAANIARSGFWMVTGLIVAGHLISAIAIILLKHFDIFDKSIIDAQDAIIAVSLMISARLFNFYRQLYDGYFRAARRAALSLNLDNMYRLLQIVSGFIVLILGGGIVPFALVSFLLAALYNPVYVLLGKNTLKLRELHSATIHKDELKATFRTGIGFLLNPVWQAIYFQGTTFVVRIVLGPGAVAIFNTVRTLSRSINQLYSILNASIFPELQYLIGEKLWGKARQLFRISLMATFVAALAGMVFLFFFGLWFYQIWTSKALDPPTAMWNIFIVGIGFNALWWTSGVVFRAFNQPYKFALSGVIGAILSVGATYFLAPVWGLTGAAIGTVVLDVFMALLILPIAIKTLKMSFQELLRYSFRDLKKYTVKLNFKFSSKS